MHNVRILALGAFVSAVASVPMPQQQQRERDIAWVTETQAVFVTLPVTTTVWVKPGQSPMATATVHAAGHQPTYDQVSSWVQSTPTVQPVPSTSSVDTTLEPTATVQAVSLSTTPATRPPLSTASATAPPPQPSETHPTTPTDTTGLSFGPAVAGTSFTAGELTWYNTGLGACGLTSAPSDHIVAVSHVTFDAYATEADGDPNDNPICGKTVTITGADGSPYTATIVDRCVGCEPDHLDLSEIFFNLVTDYADGVMSGVGWKYD